MTINPFKPEITIVIFTANCCRNSRPVVDEDDLMWLKYERKLPVLVKEFHGHFYFKTLS